MKQLRKKQQHAVMNKIEQTEGKSRDRTYNARVPGCGPVPIGALVPVVLPLILGHNPGSSSNTLFMQTYLSCVFLIIQLAI